MFPCVPGSSPIKLFIPRRDGGAYARCLSLLRNAERSHNADARGGARGGASVDQRRRTERTWNLVRPRAETDRARQVSLRKPSLPVETARTRLPFPFRCTSRVTAAARSRCAFDQTGGFLRARARAAIADRTKRRSLFVPETSPPSPSIPFAAFSALASLAHPAGWNARGRCLVLGIKGPLDIGKPQSGNTPGDVVNIEKLEIGQTPSALLSPTCFTDHEQSSTPERRACLSQAERRRGGAETGVP